jgi:multicomponent K+:H+ antiporter subunit E
MALLLLWRVFVDILRSNIAVGRIVLGLQGKREIRSGFLEIPLDIREPHALAALATIVTSTPGTIWVDLSRDGRTLTLHVLDLRDERVWIATIKQRYESLLMEIFE